MKHRVIAGFAGYNSVKQVSDFVASWHRVCEAQSELIVIYDQDSEIIPFLNGVQGVKTIQKQRAHDNGYLNRFGWFYDVINELQWEEGQLVLTADIRDVVFQLNPFAKIEELLKDGRDWVVVDEGITNDEEWNHSMLKMAFPHKVEFMHHKNVMNCGVIAGTPEAIANASQQIFEMGKTTDRETFKDPTVGECVVVYDQPAYGIYIHSLEDKSRIAFQDNSDDFCLTFSIAPLTTNVLWCINGKICNASKSPYHIVHQYDRLKDTLQWDKELNAFGLEHQGKKIYDFQIDCKINP